MKFRALTLACVLGLSPFVAKAGSLTISVTSASPAFSGSKTYTIPDADMAKFYAFVQGAYPSASLAQSILAWANGIVAGTVANVQNFNTVPAVVPPPITAN